MIKILDKFQDGLDSRRSDLTSKETSLEVASNVHINQGAEIEKRGAFVDWGALPATAFGLVYTSAGAITFGSVATPSLPSGVGYVRCQHPSDNTQGMTAVLCSCAFGGKAFCVAKFANGDVFWFYNGVVVPASINGQVLSAATSNLAVATQFYNFINTAYFQAVGIYAIAPINNAGNYFVDIYGTAGVSISLVTSIVNSAAGTLSFILVSNSTTGTAQTGAAFGFLLGMGNTGTISAVNVSTDNGATYAVTLLPSAVSWASGDLNGYQTALNIVSNITGNVNALGITANSQSNQVILSAPPASGATPNGFPVQLITTGDFCLDQLVIDFSAAVALTSTSMLAGSLTTVFHGQVYGGGSTFAVVSLPAGTYYWQKGANDVSLAISGGSTLFSSLSFTIGSPTTVTFNGTAPGLPVTAQLTKMIEILDGSAATTGTTIALFVQALATKIRAYAVAHATGYTACASTANTNQLFISRSTILSLNQFLPVVATDVTGAVSSSGTSLTQTAVIKLSFIQFTKVLVSGNNPGTATGTVNVSISGGASPYQASLSTSSQGTSMSVTLPDNEAQYPTSGSFLINVSYSSQVGGTFNYTLTLIDALGTIVTKNFTLTVNLFVITLS